MEVEPVDYRGVAAAFPLSGPVGATTIVRVWRGSCYVLRYAVPWAELPAVAGWPSGQACWRRLCRSGSRAGVWERLLVRVQELLEGEGLVRLVAGDRRMPGRGSMRKRGRRGRRGRSGAALGAVSTSIVSGVGTGLAPLDLRDVLLGEAVARELALRQACGNAKLAEPFTEAKRAADAEERLVRSAVSRAIPCVSEVNLTLHQTARRPARPSPLKGHIQAKTR